MPADTHIHTNKQSHNNPKKRKYKNVTWEAKETKNYINQLKTELTKMQTRKQNKSGVPTEELSKENKHVEKDK